jgi:ATP diphosphatase
LDEAIAGGDRDAKEHELGDVLFALANLARFIATPAEDALRQADITADARAADIREFSRAIRQREVTMRMAPPAAPAASGTKR